MIAFKRLLRSVETLIGLTDDIREHVNQPRTHRALLWTGHGSTARAAQWTCWGTPGKRSVPTFTSVRGPSI